ncbi:SusC/RagA family TonB-linked outer membrane protein [Prolixibacteraceae bacterium JC049]|nr:SusC/RagA family TonB-linked outer membrane protein [Prolixibacteraceae bacterium JC049]
MNYDPPRGGIRWMLCMKLTFILLLFTLLRTSASVYSQQAKLSVQLEDVSIEQFLKAVEKQCDYRFLYKADLFENSSKISIDANDEKLSEILEEYLVPNGYSYEVEDQMIIVRKGVVKPKAKQDKKHKITGVVTDNDGLPLPGVTVMVVGSTRGVITDPDGKYSIDVDGNEKLLFSFIGMDPQEISIAGKKTLDVMLSEKSEELDDVTVVAFAKQKKESVVASITTVKPGELKIPSSNLTTALSGRVSGMIAYQRSGEPGMDNAEFFIRGVTTFGYKKDPLILVDGNEVSTTVLSRIHPDDIAAFSIMKDATATALYGSRGANGVIVVTTKEGKEGKAKISVRAENSISTPTKMVELADPVTFMRLHNEAVKTRNRLEPVPYTQNKIDNTVAGLNPYAFPAVDWQDILFKDMTTNQRVNMNISGGGRIARYYVAASYSVDNGMLKMDSKNNFNNNIKLNRYMLRSNVNINISKSTKMNVRLQGSFDDYTGPLDGGSQLFRKAIDASSVRFPAYFPAHEDYRYVKHIMFGGSKESTNNPYADMVKGYKDYSKSHMAAQIELYQDLDFITKGLKIRGMFNTNRYAEFDISRQYQPYFYEAMSYNYQDDSYSLVALNDASATESLSYSEGKKAITSEVYFEGALEWTREFDKHNLNGLLVATRRNRLVANAGNLQKSLPSRNLNLAGRFAYNYDSRYFTEFNFGYNGSERFSDKERFGFFPSAALGWLVSNEGFYSDRLKKTLSKLKIRLTHGLSGNDAIGSNDDRFFYLSNVNLNDGSRSSTFGTGVLNRYLSGVGISRYANDQITWEIARKTNLAVEMGLFEELDVTAEVFHEYRTNILMTRSHIPATMGLQAPVRANVGETSSRGFEISLNYNKSISKDLWIQAMGNFTYASNKIEKYEEPDYSSEPWKSRVGESINQTWGLIAERLFIDEEDIRNSPKQFGDYMAGDIKYKDINNDGVINSLDEVPIGNPTVPKINYGFGFSMGYKAFDFSCFFQGSAMSSFYLDLANIAPFRNGTSAVMKAIADDHWSEDNRNEYAFWPRLSDRGLNSNNLRRSNWWLNDNSFLRLKSLEIGYTLNKNLAQRLHIGGLRIYLSGSNLLTFSNFKLWDPEMGGKGLNYPVQKVYNIGLKIDF